jgi:hypothetical protein
VRDDEEIFVWDDFEEVIDGSLEAIERLVRSFFAEYQFIRLLKERSDIGLKFCQRWEKWDVFS